MVVPVPGQTLNAPTAILFGKLPRHGDFVARGLGPARRRAWDDWLSSGLELSHRRLGDAFAAAHDRAPPWRFINGPGCLGGDWRCGAIVPSVDSVGRRFFLVLAADRLGPALAAAEGERLAREMATLVQAGIDRTWDADTLAREAGRIVAGLAENRSRDGQAPRERWWACWGPDHPPTVADAAPTNLIARAAA
jgi:type VI secretion system protein ImpM